MTEHDVTSKMYRAVCDECEVASDKESKTMANELVDFHNEGVHDENEVAYVEEVNVGDG